LTYFAIEIKHKAKKKVSSRSAPESKLYKSKFAKSARNRKMRIAGFKTPIVDQVEEQRLLNAG
jgi:hypothetical protein